MPVISRGILRSCPACRRRKRQRCLMSVATPRVPHRPWLSFTKLSMCGHLCRSPDSRALDVPWCDRTRSILTVCAALSARTCAARDRRCGSHHHLHRERTQTLRVASRTGIEPPPERRRVISHRHCGRGGATVRRSGIDVAADRRPTQRLAEAQAQDRRAPEWPASSARSAEHTSDEREKRC
jgi:hypothetical protein